MPEDAQKVSVLGLGLMGSAIARALLAKGHEVAVWNRSAGRSAHFEGISRVASSVSEACAASDVIVVCLLNCNAGNAVLRSHDIESVLPGRVLIQLTTGSPSDARRASKWADSCGADYLDGAILSRTHQSLIVLHCVHYGNQGRD